MLHVVEDFTRTNTGVAAAIRSMTEALGQQDITSAVIANRALHVDEMVIFESPAVWGNRWGYSSRLSAAFDALSAVDIVHIHGAWTHPQLYAMTWAHSNGVPFIFSPHNMLGGPMWRSSYLKQTRKEIYWRYLLQPRAQHAAAVHALSNVEADQLTSFFPRSRIVTIPNCIAHSTLIHSSSTYESYPRRLLVLGRRHPMKGIDILLAVLPMLKNSSTEFSVHIVGPPVNNAYEKLLRKLAANANRPVYFTDWIDGADKTAAQAAAWVLCAPSLSEGISMAALETMSVGTPAIVTRACGLPEIEIAGGIEVISGNSRDLARAVECALTWTVDNRVTRGNAARTYVRERHSLAVVGQALKLLYQSAIAGVWPATKSVR